MLAYHPVATSLEGIAMSDEGPGIPLASAIEDLRSELLNALKEGVGKELHFRLKPIELEFSLAITGSGKVKGGVKFWVVEFGAEVEGKRESTHKLKLVLEPIGLGGAPYEVASSDSQKPKIG